MSVKAMTYVWDCSPYTLGSRLVHLALADVANDTHGNKLWMYQEQIAAKARLSVSQVQRILSRMVEDGALIELERGIGRGKPSIYQLVIKTPQYDTVSEKTPHRGQENPASTTFRPLIEPKEPKGEKPRILHAGIMTSRRSGPTDFSDADPNVSERVNEIRESLKAPQGERSQ